MATVSLGLFSGGLRGRWGNAVFVQTPNGTVVRDRVVPRDPMSPAQRANRDRMGRASNAWSSLTLAQISAWEDFALLRSVRNPSTGQMVSPRPQNLFVQLYAKMLAVNPSAPVPVDPPSSVFLGDNVTVTVSASPGSVVFTADLPNGPDVVSELLLQPLASPVRRTYLEKYRTAGFFVFSPPSRGSFAAGASDGGGSSLGHAKDAGTPPLRTSGDGEGPPLGGEDGIVVIPVAPGVYAAAVRFVRISDGQCTGLAELGRVSVA